MALDGTRVNWLEPKRVLSLAGYVGEVPEKGSKEADALTFAEQSIEGATDAVWGRSEDFTLRFTCNQKETYLELPFDVRSIREVAPLPAKHRPTLTTLGLALLDAEGFEVPWEKGRYVVRGTRGVAVIPEEVTKAGSLLAAYYLDLSDPDRSRYEGLSMGDFSGTMRLSSLPVPEAAALLRKYSRRVRVG